MGSVLRSEQVHPNMFLYLISTPNIASIGSIIFFTLKNKLMDSFALKAVSLFSDFEGKHKGHYFIPPNWDVCSFLWLLSENSTSMSTIPHIHTLLVMQALSDTPCRSCTCLLIPWSFYSMSVNGNGKWHIAWAKCTYRVEPYFV